MAVSVRLWFSGPPSPAAPGRHLRHVRAAFWSPALKMRVGEERPYL